MLLEIIFATSWLTISSAILNTPASSSALADSINFSAVSFVFPWTRYPWDNIVVCGCNPIWPITGIPVSTIALMVSAISIPPSSFTASAPAFINLPEFFIASETFAWYDMKGRSPTTNAFCLARLTASVNIFICVIVTGIVFSYPNMTIPPLSPTSKTSTPALSHSDAKE